MKQLFLAILFTQALAGISNSVRAQSAVSSLNENFESNCPSGWHHPNGWADFNPIPSTRPDGQWQCTNFEGRSDSRGIKCTGLWGTPMAYHLDTALLMSPRLNLSSYVGKPIYLRFDSKTSKINLGAKISVVAVTDSAGENYIGNLDQLMSPVFSNDDSTDWVTHEFDLGGFTTAGDFYVAFRYTSTATSGSVWYLDNIVTSTFSLNVPGGQMPTVTLPLTATGNSAAGEVKVAFTADKAEKYDLVICDVVGRIVHRRQLDVHAGTHTYLINGLNIGSGVHILRVANSNTLGTTKFLVD